MAKSLKKLLIDASELVAIFGLTLKKISSVRVTLDGQITFHIDAIELVRVSRQMDVPRSKIDVYDDGNQWVHISFIARGARWVALIKRAEIADFYVTLGVPRPYAIGQRNYAIAQDQPEIPLLLECTHDS